MSETAKARAARLMDEVGNGNQQTYERGEVKTILNTIAMAGDEVSTSRATISVDELRRGDVFIAKLIGGKTRPWIVLRIVGEIVTAIPMSSGDHAPNMTRALCRLWPGSWIGNTVSQFLLEDATREVTRPYTDRHHLTEVEQQIYRRLGAAVVGPKSIAEIREKIHA